MMIRKGTKAVAALSILLAACSGSSDSGGSGGSTAGGTSMFIQSCTLGCSNGLGGVQVSCQILNTFENADLSIAFSRPVNLATATSTSFRIININDGSTPNGTYVLSPTNPNRLIFRPQLVFNASGDPVYGFKEGETYQVIIAGEAQGDSPPFIRSTSGKANQSRLVCQITTNGIADTVPGRPTYEVFVDDPNNPGGPMVLADGQTNVPPTTSIVVVFNDLMKLGSLLVPSNPSAPSPSISFLIDPDGNLADPSDQVPLPGNLSFQVDFQNLTTTITLDPANGLPSGGTGSPKRQILVDVSDQAFDLADNAVQPAPPIVFEPETINFPQETIAETFTNTAGVQFDQSGASMWAQGGMLVPGEGGGSGRLGELVVGTSEVRTLYTGAMPATASIGFLGNPCDGETIRVEGTDYIFLDDTMSPPAGFTAVQRAAESIPGTSGDDLFLTVNYFVDALNANSPGGAVTYEARTPSPPTSALYEVVGRAATPGSSGNALEVGGINGVVTSEVGMCAGAPSPQVTTSGLFFTGGLDGESFAPGSLIDNTDFSMGGMPGPIAVNDGVFEFSKVRIAATGRLVLRGPNPARIFSRGRFTIEPASVIDLAGSGPSLHDGRPADGEPGAFGGPNAGRGGRGADRPDDTGSTLISNLKGGIENPGASLNGARGEGLAGSSDAEGSGGVRWPLSFPSEDNVLGGLDANLAACNVFMTPGPGSGGAYAVDGQAGFVDFPLYDSDSDGVPDTVLPATGSGFSNAPDLNMDGTIEQTPGGDSSEAGIEPVGAPLDVRLLDPDSGDLRGGSGGGGGGASCYGSQLLDANINNTCNDPADSVFSFTTSSGGGGGGGGGAAQFQAGENLDVSGFIDASGGAGGDAFADPTDPNLPYQASPGGGGSGGAILAQGANVLFATGAPRITVAGGFGGSGLQSSVGGAGAPGLIRVEDASMGIDQMTIAGLVLPEPGPLMDPLKLAILSAGPGDFTPDPSSRPGAFSGVQSCWMTATGNFFGLTFEADGVGTFGWSLDLEVINPMTMMPETVSYRDPANNGGFTVPAGMSWQEFLGEEIEDGVVASPAPFVVRFQGAKRSVQITDFCNVSVAAQTTGLTPWVRHPAELNTFSPRPDIVRFAIIFDRAHPLADMIVGVDNLMIEVTPD